MATQVVHAKGASADSPNKISAIDGIAFQTNIVGLNVAVEAACASARDGRNRTAKCQSR
jgi:methyl-accepting chemotaxis protein